MERTDIEYDRLKYADLLWRARNGNLRAAIAESRRIDRQHRLRRLRASFALAGPEPRPA